MKNSFGKKKDNQGRPLRLHSEELAHKKTKDLIKILDKSKVYQCLVDEYNENLVELYFLK